MPPQPERATYRKFRSRSSEDRPCAAVAAVRGGDGLRVVVGAVAETPQDFPDLCDGEPAEVGRAVRGADRAAERLARLGRVPPARDRRRGAARGGGGRLMDPRVTGEQRYSVDVERPGMLHAAFVRSPHPHARVLSVDASAVPAGCVVLTPGDVADLGRYGCQVKDQRVLADVARHAGDVVAAVAAPTRAAARAAARLVEVALRGAAGGLRPARGGRAAARRSCTSRRPPRRGDAVSIDVRPIAGTNVCHRFRIRHGDVADGLRAGRRGRRGGLPHRRAPRTRRWSRTPRSPSGRTAG